MNFLFSPKYLKSKLLLADCAGVFGIVYIVHLDLGTFGPHPGGSCGGRRGLSFYVGVKGRYVVVQDKQQKDEIFHFTWHANFHRPQTVLKRQPDEFFFSKKYVK